MNAAYAWSQKQVMLGVIAIIQNLLFAKTVGKNSRKGLPAQSAEQRARCDLLKNLRFGDEVNQRLENTTLPDGLHKELYIRRRFQSEAGQDESWERAGDLEFGSQPMLKPKGNLQLQPCPYRKPRDHIQLLCSEDQAHSHSYVAKMRLTASTVSQLLRTIWD
jgi:hypothetical protein